MAETIRISAKKRPGQFLISKPADVSVDGLAVGQVPWKGEGVAFPTEPGRHVVTVDFESLGKRCGKATTEVDVAPDQEVALLYRSPWVVPRPGSLEVQ